MKWILFVLLALNGLGASAQQSIFSTYADWRQHLREARDQQKKIFLFFNASWCVACHTLEKNVLSDPSVISLMRNNFLSYSLDLDDRRSIPFIKKYRVTNLPVILILNGDGSLVERQEGVPQDIPGYEKWIGGVIRSRNVIKAFNNELDLKYPDFYNEFFERKMKKQPDSAVVDNYLRSQKDLTEEVNWDVLSLFNRNDEYFYVLRENEKKFKELYGMEVSFKIMNMYGRIAQRYIDSRDSVSFNKLTYFLLQPRDAVDTPAWRAFRLREIKFLGVTGMDPSKLIRKVQAFEEVYGPDEDWAICQYAYEKCTDTADCAFLLQRLDALMERSPFNPRQMYFVRGVLLLKIRRTGEAQVAFDHSLSACKSDEERNIYRKKIADASQKYAPQ